MVNNVFSTESIAGLADVLSKIDPVFDDIISAHGYPKMHPREPGFPSLVRLILEQQVSLVSAKATYVKLIAKVKEITPENILALSDKELKDCYLSRQKSSYVRALAEAIVNHQLDVNSLTNLPDDEVRRQLISIKGIGHWTIDSYLLLVLNRTDIFPIGDIALVNSIKKNKRLAKETPAESLLSMSEQWRPFRSIATLLFWHAYIIDKKIDWDKIA